MKNTMLKILSVIIVVGLIIINLNFEVKQNADLNFLNLGNLKLTNAAAQESGMDYTQVIDSDNCPYKKIDGQWVAGVRIECLTGVEWCQPDGCRYY